MYFINRQYVCMLLDDNRNLLYKYLSPGTFALTIPSPGKIFTVSGVTFFKSNWIVLPSKVVTLTFTPHNASYRLMVIYPITINNFISVVIIRNCFIVCMYSMYVCMCMCMNVHVHTYVTHVHECMFLFCNIHT